METASKLWDLNNEAESPEKAGFLLLSGCNKPPWKEKRRKKGHKTRSELLIYLDYYGDAPK
jgi:hypothetical protein